MPVLHTSPSNTALTLTSIHLRAARDWQQPWSMWPETIRRTHYSNHQFQHMISMCCSLILHLKHNFPSFLIGTSPDYCEVKIAIWDTFFVGIIDTHRFSLCCGCLTSLTRGLFVVVSKLFSVILKTLLRSCSPMSNHKSAAISILNSLNVTSITLEDIMRLNSGATDHMTSHSSYLSL